MDGYEALKERFTKKEEKLKKEESEKPKENPDKKEQEGENYAGSLLEMPQISSG